MNYSIEILRTHSLPRIDRHIRRDRNRKRMYIALAMFFGFLAGVGVFLLLDSFQGMTI